MKFRILFTQKKLISLFLSLFILLTCRELYGQQHFQGSVTGSIMDTTGKGLPDVSIGLVRASDSSLIKGVISNAEGKYTFSNISKGSYRICASLLEHKDAWSAPFSLD